MRYTPLAVEETVELIEQIVPITPKYGGRQNVILPAGKFLKIETNPDGEEILNAEVPAGKSWEVVIAVSIQESDV